VARLRKAGPWGCVVGLFAVGAHVESCRNAEALSKTGFCATPQTDLDTKPKLSEWTGLFRRPSWKSTQEAPHPAPTTPPATTATSNNQTSNNTTQLQHSPQSYLSMARQVRALIAEGGTPPAAVRVGVNLNWEKVCGCPGDLMQSTKWGPFWAFARRHWLLFVWVGRSGGRRSLGFLGAPSPQGSVCAFAARHPTQAVEAGEGIQACKARVPPSQPPEPLRRFQNPLRPPPTPPTPPATTQTSSAAGATCAPP
jgi:hypothetical protein